MHLYDAHNHLQDDRFGGRQPDLIAACQSAGVLRMVVNGSCEEDWPKVARLAEVFPMVIPSFGYHPWYIAERSPDWPSALRACLDRFPFAVGEIGLDRWKPGLSYDGQEEVFTDQLLLAAERNLPVSIHCLQAWGRLHQILLQGPRPACGFLLHSYGGPIEMVQPLAKLGAYFSFPGYFLHPRKSRQREAFAEVPIHRLLVETDAPDQSPPVPSPAGSPPRDNPSPFPIHSLSDATSGRPINHPANLPAIFEGLAGLRGMQPEALAGQVETNFLTLFRSFSIDQPARPR